MNNEIGKRIFELRNRRNLTQEELAEMVGSVPSYISNIERKNKCPSLTLLQKIVKALDTSFDYLLIDEFEMNKQMEVKYKDMFKEISKLDNQTQDEFFEITDKILKSLKTIENNYKN